MKKLLTYLILVTISSNALADSVVLKKGQEAPFDGVLNDHKTSQKIVLDLEEGDYNKRRVEQYLKIIELQDLALEKRAKQYDILVDQNKILHDRLEKTESNSGYERLIWFGLGVLGTGISVYGAQKLLNR